MIIGASAMIQDFINDVCDILNISVPIVSFDVSNFQTETMLAQIDSSGTTIYLKKFDKPNPDQFFSIAHELRHKWQIQTDKELYFSDYKPRELCASTEEYNSQLAEIDAHAFAGIVMEEFFHLKPLFHGLPDSVKSKIYNRMEQISALFYFP